MDRRALKRASHSELLRELEQAQEDLRKAEHQYEHTRHWIQSCKDSIKEKTADGWIYYDLGKYSRYLPKDHAWYQTEQARVKYIQKQLESRWRLGGRVN